MTRFQHALADAPYVVIGRVRDLFRMRMPIADEVEAQGKTFFDFEPFDLSIGNVKCPGSTVAASRPSSLHHDDPSPVDPCEQLPARLPVPCSNLAVSLEVFKHIIAEHQNLA
jgi:hypothetical protein